MILSPLFKIDDEKLCSGGNKISAGIVPLHDGACKDIKGMAGILLWLMGVPLVVIILLYLLF
jgi:hypothetical protein